jgi:hypothetical protein
MKSFPKNFRLFSAFLAILALALMAPAAKAQTGTTTWSANPTPLVQTRDLAAGFPPDPVAFSQTSITTGNASTTSVAITNLTGRKKIVFIPNATGDLWVSVGTTTAVVNGSNCIKVPYGDELTLEVDANVPLGTIASTAFQFTHVQFGRRQGQQ